MGLIRTPPWYFTSVTDNLPAQPTQSLIGTSLTSGTSNAEGTAVSLIAAVTHEVHYLVISIAGFNTASAAAYTLVDILIDRAGGTAWSSFIDNLLVGYTNAVLNTAGGSGLIYAFPIRVPSGASIGARAQTSHTVAATGAVAIWAYGNPSRPDMWWTGSAVETLGVTSASSIGTSVTPGSTGVWGTWTNVGSVTSGRYGAVQFGTNGTDATATLIAYLFEIGYLSQQVPGTPTWHRNMTTTEVGAQLSLGPTWCDIPKGTQMQVRGMASGTAEAWAGGVAIYGVY